MSGTHFATLLIKVIALLRRSSAIGAGLLMLLVPATPILADGRRLQEVTDVLVVEIPVQVTRAGQPVRGLTADDFEVRDRGQRREIVGFDAIDLTSEPAGESSPRDVPRSARRYFLFLFDLALTNPGLILRARDAARRLVDEALHPTDLSSVAAPRQWPRIACVAAP